MFYIYAYLRKDGSPYYVGKGKNYRAYSPVHTVGVPKDKNRIVFWHSELHEQDAFDLEIFYIQLFGRKVDGGILRNMTLGGQGASGKKTSEKTKKLISARNKGSKRTPEARAKMALAQLGRKRGPMSQEQKDAISKGNRGKSRGKGVKKSPEHVAKVAKKLKGIPRSQEVRDKISKANKGKPGTWIGRTHTDASKQKMSQSAKNRIVSAETRKLLSLKTKLYWEQKKAQNI